LTYYFFSILLPISGTFKADEKKRGLAREGSAHARTLKTRLDAGEKEALITNPTGRTGDL
jgi:hypothetical protein